MDGQNEVELEIVVSLEMAAVFVCTNNITHYCKNMLNFSFESYY